VHKYYGHTRMSDTTHCTYVHIRAVVGQVRRKHWNASDTLVKGGQMCKYNM
jgi:hypothetical protein